ncbi:alpha/beta-hydrolase [Rhizodiscina lignyota]|uniref:Alpha/beta-hydrolase n=1 Tax=Rhizodiscina lignyota TaxID=1504668 RepID=A0A9P4I3P9_9PEZI|nr:alpha/beta-hydrolase [Rhizodiscina lignyota]
MPPKPHIVLIHGAYHDSSTWSLLEPLLNNAGYETSALDLPSVGAEPPLTTIAPDVEYVRSVITPMVEAGKSVVVVLHSYSGIIGTTSLSGLTAEHRSAQKLPGGVTALVYLCAWMLDVGQSTVEMGGGRGGKLGPAAVRNDGKHLWHLKPIEAFYHDIPREEAEARASKLRHHSAQTLQAKVEHAAWKEVPVTYLVCRNDVTIPAEHQWACIKQAKGKGAQVTVAECDSGHSPMLSMPALVCKVVKGAAGEEFAPVARL